MVSVLKEIFTKPNKGTSKVRKFSPLAGEEAVVCDAKRALQMQVMGRFSRNNKTLSRISKFTSFTKKFNPLPEVEGKRGFTLAEVLITLGIIGVVAALTIPTIATKYRKYVLLNKIKHTYTLLNNTLERAKADFGTDINQWEISEGTKLDRSTFFVENYMLPYLNVLQYCGSDYTKQGCFEHAKRLDEGVADISPMNSNHGTSFILNNGTYVYLEVGRGNASEPENTNRIEILFDVNGPDKGKNTYGYDVFDVELGGDEGRTLRNSANKNKFLPY